MSETATTERTTEQVTAEAPKPAPVAESAPVAQKPAGETTPRPRIPRAHCAC